MSSVMNHGKHSRHRTSIPSKGRKQQSQEDRRYAVVVVAVMVLVFALIVWMASLASGVSAPGIDYWPMMP